MILKFKIGDIIYTDNYDFRRFYLILSFTDYSASMIRLTNISKIMPILEKTHEAVETINDQYSKLIINRGETK